MRKKRGDDVSIVIDHLEYYGIIYKVTNIITNESYIGQTTEAKGYAGRYKARGSGVERIYNFHAARKRRKRQYNHRIVEAVEQYGFDAFVVDEVFDVAMTAEELNFKENAYIKQFDCICHGYNLASAGNANHKRENLPGQMATWTKRVCQISPTGELIKIWNSLHEAAKTLGLHQGAMSNVCRGRKETSGGFVWIYESDYDPSFDYSRIPKTRGGGKASSKPLLLFDENGQIIREFGSAVEASQCLGISKQEISKICLGIRKTPKCQLMFKSKYIEEQRLSVEGLTDEELSMQQSDLVQ